MAEQNSRSVFRHRMAWWGLFIVLLFAAWFGGWFLIANYAEGKIEETIVQLRQDGVDLNCGNRSMQGFPFRIGVRCDQVEIARSGNDMKLNTGALRTTAVLYAPGEMIAELDSPARLFEDGVEIQSNWEMMRLYTDADLSGGFERLSLNFRKFIASAGPNQLSVEEGGVHLRPAPTELQSLDVAANFDDLTAALAQEMKVPKASLNFDIKLKDGYRKLVLERRSLQQMLSEGTHFDVRSIILISHNGGKLALAGPLELNRDGTITGTLRIGMADPEALGQWAAEMNPQFKQGVEMARQAVAGMGIPKNIAGHEMRSIELAIERSEIRLGFIKLGEIPPLEFHLMNQ